MIKITKKNDEIIFTGHTLENICACVSCIMYTTVNALEKYSRIRKRDDIFTYEDNLEDDFVKIKIQFHDEIVDMLIENMFSNIEDVIEDNNEDKIQLIILK